MAALLVVTRIYAADPQAYKVTFAETGNGELDGAIKATSQLQTLREKGPVAPFVLVGRAQQDVERLQVVLRGYGYYDGKVKITVAGHPLGDPDLVDAIDSLAKGETASIEIGFETGALYRLGKVTVDGDVPEDARAKLGLAPGEAAIASNVLNAQARLRNAIEEDGYPLAVVDAPVAVQDSQSHTLDVSITVHAGPQAKLGEIRLSGLGRVHEDFVRKRLLVHTGERYSPSRIEKARMDLLALGVFSGISVRIEDHLDEQGRIPVVFDMQERARHGVGVGGAYSTDLGGSAKLTWSQRNLLGNAEQLNLSAAVTGLGGTASEGLGYNLTAQLVKPDFGRRDQSIAFNVGAIDQKLEAYDQNALSTGVSLSRKISDLWSAGFGVSGERERILQEGVARDYTLLGLPLSGQFNSTGMSNPLDDALHGVRATLTVTPTESFGPDNETFIILQGNVSTYFDLASLGWTQAGRSVIALRALAGSAYGASMFSLPPDQRFYGGGSTTVRGYRFQSLGPQFPDQKPIGGTSIDAGTIEFRQRLMKDYGVAVFVDAGQVGTTGDAFRTKVYAGTGLGLRYYTPIGAVRLDIAVPIDKQPGSDTFEVYVGLGQAF